MTESAPGTSEVKESFISAQKGTTLKVLCKFFSSFRATRILIYTLLLTKAVDIFFQTKIVKIRSVHHFRPIPF